ncbi:MAG: peptide deformylase [SAR86 cluster bacterium]|uniref:Peptide deformylase n=1 Tax=SAR86 cluster bacterium TaxID=2030880 RepID=A0A2A5CJ37_9GAMM|nr:peptide deformylase [Gammaproteobacteria bacterium AH-315-E17]PCJ43538.1 MAG: peptide deformylase [SAR86 cluster bacterium]
MSLLEILEFPDPRLRKKALPVDKVDDALKQTIDDMFETMYAASGIGLAAIQVSIQKRLLIIDLADGEEGEEPKPLVFINPEITVLDPTPYRHEEGCLSVPGYFEFVERPQKVLVNALNREGEAFEIEAEGLLAVCVQHEIDHLNGKLFVDYLSVLKRQRIKSKLEKEHKQNASA